MFDALLVGTLFAAGFCVCFLLARRTADPFLVRIVALGYTVRTVLAAALYYGSLWGVPVWRDAQLGDGFWSFAPDAVGFHRYATVAALALRSGLDLPPASMFGDPEYPLMMAAIYWGVGGHPLLAIWLNIVLASFTVLLAYSLARRLGGGHASRTAAALIALWPSSLVWAAQLLKDTIEVFLVVAFLWAFQRMIAGPDTIHATHPRAARMAAVSLALLTLVMAVRLRFYVGLLLFVSAAAVLAANAVIMLWRRHSLRAAMAGALAVSLAAAIVASTWIPREPRGTIDSRAGIERLAALLVSIGDRENADWLRVAYPMEAPMGAPAVPQGSQFTGLPVPQLFRYLSVSYLADVRRGYFNYSGSVLGQADDLQRDAVGLIRFAPRALANTFLSPNPWTPFDSAALPGLFRRAAMAENLLVVVLLCFSARGVMLASPAARPVALLIAAFSLLLAVALGTAIPHVGAIFRLRLAVIVPLCILAGTGGLFQYLARAGRWVSARCFPAVAPA